MRRINKLLASFCALGLSTVQGQNIGTEVADKKLEQRTWPAVSNGLVFVEGEFLSPPYIVSRVRNAIYINGRHIDSPGLWPCESKKENLQGSSPLRNPNIPMEISEKTTMYDDIFIRYIYEKRQYLFATYGQEKGIDMMVGVYSNLPCVKNASRDTERNSTINVTWKSGKVTHINQIRHSRSQDNGTPEQAAKMFDDICEIYSRGLDLNDYFIFGSTQRTGTQDGYGQFLVPIAEALKTSKDEEAFVAVMTNKFPMVTGFSEKAFRSFYKYKDKLPQWEPLLQKRCKGRQ